MIAASESEFRAGWAQNGQTKEHALLAYTLGVKRLICCVNKMDEPSVLYSQDRFNVVSHVDVCVSVCVDEEEDANNAVFVL